MEGDLTVIKQIISGHTEEYRLLVEKYQNPVYRVILKMVGNTDNARELTQDVFVKAYESIDQYKPEFKFFSWIYRIAINRALLFEKQEKIFRPIDEKKEYLIPDQRKDNDTAYRDHLLEFFVNELNEHYKSVILLKYYAGLSYSDISDSLKIPEKTVKSRLFDARKILKEKLTGVGFFSRIYS